MSAAFRLSLGANLVLLIAVAILLWPDDEREHASLSPATPAADAKIVARRDANAATGIPATATAPDQTTMTPAAMDQLEQMGVSRDVLVNAVLGEFHRNWDQRFVELEQRHAPRPVPEREYIELARQRDAAQVEALREALGETRYLAWDKEQTLRAHNPGGIPLNSAEAEKIYRLQKAFNERHRELQMALEDGFADVVDVGTLQAQAEAALDQELQQLLGKERFQRMRGINDPVTDVYQKFGHMNPTTDQAHALVLVEEDHRARETTLAARLSSDPAAAANLPAALEALQAEHEDELRQIFGGEVYDSMSRQNDPTFKRLHQFAEAWELTEPEIDSVYASLRAFQDEAERARSAAAMREAAGQPVDWHEVNAAIEQARQQTESGLQHLIGDNRLWRMKQDGLLTMR